MGHLPPVVRVVVPSKEELELGVVALLVHGHLLKLGTIASNKSGQLVYYSPYFLVCREINKEFVYNTEIAQGIMRCYLSAHGYSNYSGDLGLHFKLAIPSGGLGGANCE